MKKIFITFVSIFFLSVSYGQKEAPLYPNGFHIGILGQGNIAQRMTVIPVGSNIYVPPETYPALGWDAGLEFSYHFAKNFGFSAGVNYGTIIQYKGYEYLGPTGGYMNGPSYLPFCLGRGWCAEFGLQVPLRFEFHHSILKSNFFVYASAGVNLQDICERILFKGDWGIMLRHGGHDEQSTYQHILIGDYRNKITVDLQLNLGAYYRLPYNDLIRLNLLMNYAFKDRLQGTYRYLQVDDAYGTLSYRHNLLGLELAYIHCFKHYNRQERENNEDSYAYDFSKPIHSLTFSLNNATGVNSRVDNKLGVISPRFLLSYSPSVSLKYGCTFAKGNGLSLELTLGTFFRKFSFDWPESFPRDTVWSNGAVGLDYLSKGASAGMGIYGLSLKYHYLSQIHKNVFIQPEIGISFNPLIIEKNTTYLNTTLLYIDPADEEGEILLYGILNSKLHARNNWLPNLSGAVNFLVHGKNPCHNFVFGLNFNVDFSKRMTIDYQTVPTFPDKYKSSGQVVFNMTTIGLHVGYQFMTGRRQGIGNRE